MAFWTLGYKDQTIFFTLQTNKVPLFTDVLSYHKIKIGS